MNLVTHNGKFHADDVFGTALMLQLYPDAEVVRTRDEAVIAEADVVYDLGGVFDSEKRRFDHHQQGSPVRDNGIIYSGFGLLWRQYGREFCDGNEDVWRLIDEQFVQQIDAEDNGQTLSSATEFNVLPVSISTVIGYYNPSGAATDEERYMAFMEAVHMAMEVLLKLRAQMVVEQAALDTFAAQYAVSPDKRYAVLNAYISADVVAEANPELAFIVFPDETLQAWRVRAVPDVAGSFAVRRRFPEAWRGLRDAEMAATSGVPSAIFCHKAGFLAVATTRDGALALLQKALA
jgi:uncharacterized UPF0160 family protein